MRMIQRNILVDNETLSNFIAESSRLEYIVFKQNNIDRGF
ncbi:hypothetical protein L1283_001977 [Sphingobacterium sp. HSC-15S19]